MSVKVHAFFEHGRSVDALCAWGSELGGEYRSMPSEALFRDEASAIMDLSFGVMFVGARLALVSGDMRWSTFHRSSSERDKWLANVATMSAESPIVICGGLEESWLEALDFGFDFATLVRRCVESLGDPFPWPIEAGRDPFGAWYLLPASEARKALDANDGANEDTSSLFRSFFRWWKA